MVFSLVFAPLHGLAEQRAECMKRLLAVFQDDFAEKPQA
jgi:hypothetical protein